MVAPTEPIASPSPDRNPSPRDRPGRVGTRQRRYRPYTGGDGEPARWPRSGRSGGRVEESPDSTGHGCWREPGRGDLPVQGNREQTADGGAPGDRWPAQARVKRCGKSAPASGATPAAGNPHPEQGQAWDGRPGRCPQVGRKDGWPPGGDRKGTAYRIRLTGRLTVTHPSLSFLGVVSRHTPCSSGCNCSSTATRRRSTSTRRTVMPRTSPTRSPAIPRATAARKGPGVGDGQRLGHGWNVVRPHAVRVPGPRPGWEHVDGRVATDQPVVERRSQASSGDAPAGPPARRALTDAPDLRPAGRCRRRMAADS